MVETHDRYHTLAIDLMGVNIIKLGRNNSWCIHGAVEFLKKMFITFFGKGQRKGAIGEVEAKQEKQAVGETKRQKGEGTKMQAWF